MWNQSIIKKITNFRNINPESIRGANGRLNTTTSPTPLNNLDIDTFETADRQRLMEIMIHKFLPCFNRLANSTNEDKEMIEEIRQDWLSILDNNLAGTNKTFY